MRFNVPQFPHHVLHRLTRILDIGCKMLDGKCFPLYYSPWPHFSLRIRFLVFNRKINLINKIVGNGCHVPIAMN